MEQHQKLYKKVGFISDGQIELYKHMYHHLIVNKNSTVRCKSIAE